MRNLKILAVILVLLVGLASSSMAAPSVSLNSDINNVLNLESPTWTIHRADTPGRTIGNGDTASFTTNIQKILPMLYTLRFEGRVRVTPLTTGVSVTGVTVQLQKKVSNVWINGETKAVTTQSLFPLSVDAETPIWYVVEFGREPIGIPVGTPVRLIVNVTTNLDSVSITSNKNPMPAVVASDNEVGIFTLLPVLAGTASVSNFAGDIAIGGPGLRIGLNDPVGTNYTFTVSMTAEGGPENGAVYNATELRGLSYGGLFRDTHDFVIVGTPPNAPSTLTAIGANLAWVDNSLNEVGFIVVRYKNAAFTLEKTKFYLPADTTAWEDTTAVSGQTYYYKICAWNYIGISAYSNTTTN